MDHREIQVLLNDFVDGTLSEQEQVEVRHHLQDCTLCAHEVAGLRALLSRVQEVPRSLEPARDLWPDIEGRLAVAPKVVPLRRRWRQPAGWGVAVSLAAAAVLLVVLLPRERAPHPPEERSANAEPVVMPSYLPAVVWALENECLAAGKQVVASVQGWDTEEGTAAAVAVQMSMRAIDDAIEETREALQANPQDSRLIQMLTARYQRKLSMLHEAMRLAAEA